MHASACFRHAVILDCDIGETFDCASSSLAVSLESQAELRIKAMADAAGRSSLSRDLARHDLGAPSLAPG
jgi:hypothetical protein